MAARIAGAEGDAMAVPAPDNHARAPNAAVPSVIGGPVYRFICVPLPLLFTLLGSCE
jgi:hypothetical protein